MALADLSKKSKKRKVVEEQVPIPAAFPHDVGLDMQSEDEGEEGDAEGSEDDGEVDEFPEIDARSDSEDEEGGGSEGDEESEVEEDSDDGDEDEEEDGDSDSELDTDDDDLHIYPKPKTVISDITGQPKRVYPEIEPDYDSDSSTEDVRSQSYIFFPETWNLAHFLRSIGTQPCRKHTNALVRRSTACRLRC